MFVVVKTACARLQQLQAPCCSNCMFYTVLESQKRKAGGDRGLGPSTGVEISLAKQSCKLPIQLPGAVITAARACRLYDLARAMMRADGIVAPVVT